MSVTHITIYRGDLFVQADLRRCIDRVYVKSVVCLVCVDDRRQLHFLFSGSFLMKTLYKIRKRELTIDTYRWHVETLGPFDISVQFEIAAIHRYVCNGHYILYI